MLHHKKMPVRLRSLHRQEKAVSWLELFFDLVFVAAISQVGVPFAHNYTFAGLARYAFLFFLIWWAWLGHTMFNTRFLSDDSLQRLLTLVQIFAVAVMAANAKEALSSRDAAGFAAAYAVMRVVLVAQYVRARRVLEARFLASLHSVGFGIAALFWLGAAFAEAPVRFWLWGIALALDLATPALAFHYTRKLPPDAAHVPERFGLFTIILMGESVMATMRGIESQERWFAQAGCTAFLGMCLAFTYWWWYFDHSGASGEHHISSKKRAVNFHVWTYSHFFLYLAIAATGIGVEHAISLADGEHLQKRASVLFLSAVMLFMLAMQIISYFSNRRPPRKTSVRGLIFIAMLLATTPLAIAASPTVVLALVVSMCAFQIFGGRQNESAVELPSAVQLELVE